MRARRMMSENRHPRPSAQYHFNAGAHYLEEAIRALHLAWDTDVVYFERTGLLPVLEALEASLQQVEGMARRGRPMGV